MFRRNRLKTVTTRYLVTAMMDTTANHHHTTPSIQTSPTLSSKLELETEARCQDEIKPVSQ